MFFLVNNNVVYMVHGYVYASRNGIVSCLSEAHVMDFKCIIKIIDIRCEKLQKTSRSMIEIGWRVK
jgi:hypothetical protein